MRLEEKTKAKKALSIILDYLFPKKCVGCEKDDVWLCEKCLAEIVFIKTPTCPFCGSISDRGKLCSRCRAKSNLTGVFVMAHYQDKSPLQKAIWTFKYNYAKDVGEILGELLVGALGERQVDFYKSVIIPVPLHKKRKRQRGFNQAEILAEKIQKKFYAPVEKDILKRTRFTKSQIELSGRKRRENIKEAFVAEKKAPFSKVYLVDDVFTTGSTLNESAKALRKAGAREVWGIVLAKH